MHCVCEELRGSIVPIGESVRYWMDTHFIFSESSTSCDRDEDGSLAMRLARNFEFRGEGILQICR